MAWAILALEVLDMEPLLLPQRGSDFLEDLLGEEVKNYARLSETDFI